MNQRITFTTFRTLLMIATLSLASTALPAASQEPPPKGAKPNPDKEEALSEDEKTTRRAAEQFVNTIELEMLSEYKWAKVKRIEKPLLYFSDDTRGHKRGSVWAWGEKGRPVAVLELFQDSGKQGTIWISSLCNTSGGKVRASRVGEPWWMENESDVVINDVPQAPAPAAETAQRQRQLKLLSQKFTGHEIWDPNNSRYELRRIERPVHAYRDEATGLLDGGLIILANGTNPEILLFVEARSSPKDKSKAVWQYLVGRSSHAELHLEFDGKEVFDCPRGNRLSGPRKPYFLSRIVTDPDLEK